MLSVQYQVAEGIDAVIVDSVLGITNGLIQRRSPNPSAVSDLAADITVPALERVKQSTLSPDVNPPSTLL
jgi:glycerophosphodiester phosphodiesterase